ncbi:Forkhead domain-containing protein [Pleurostoma richardsiae]|uniref:Forkhead domain-containing protein n=1 Tax=Pleurostoma richardsiae TaxID=41990 RepID=A0AA38RKS5_9PEZI|nr:Forkhead domain-containing protein [Pleurostoma richardsiae]
MTSSQQGHDGLPPPAPAPPPAPPPASAPASHSPHPPNQPDAAAGSGLGPTTTPMHDNPIADHKDAGSAQEPAQPAESETKPDQEQRPATPQTNPELLGGAAGTANTANPVPNFQTPQAQIRGHQNGSASVTQDSNVPTAALDMDMDMFQQQQQQQQHAMATNYNHLIMALAQISSANQASPLPTVTPSQVSLPTSANDAADPLALGNGLNPGGASAAAAAAATQNLESFARIEFADSVFQMTTYAVIIGRDQRALEQARRDERRAEEHQRHVEENAVLGLPPPSPPSHDRGKFSKSYVSEEGGMLGPESDGENPRPSKRRKTSTGEGSAPKSEQHAPAAAAEDQSAAQDPNNEDLISNRQYVSHTPGAAAVDLTSLRPSPNHVPFIGIHSPGPNIASKTKAISREHLKIQFNREKGVFEAIPLHRNGFFREDVHYSKEKVVLKSGDHLQIKDVDFVFVINGVEHGKTGAEEAFEEEETSSKRYSENGKEMSFEFESSRGGELRDTSEDESEAEKVAVRVEESEEEDAEAEAQEEENDREEGEGDEEVMETVESDHEGQVKPELQPELDLLQLPIPPRKRGPGRPPKNGIMSKREERLLKKQMQEAAKKRLPQPPPGEPPVKRKVGRPRKHPLPEDGADNRPEKRKYKPRKPKNEEGGEVSDGGEKPVKEKRREKPKTPPLELKMEDFTEEQLQKPNKNYGVLIDEVLTEAPPEGLTLKQIYKRIQKRYPYYFFVVDTKGWESSVRHNLIGNDAFKKNEETHLWCRVPGIELDAGKKRKATSPDQTAASLYNYSAQYQAQMGQPPHLSPGQHGMMPGPPGYPPGGMPPQRYPPPAGQIYPGQQAVPQYAPQPGNPVAPQAPARSSFSATSQSPAPVPASAQLPGYPPPGPPRPQFTAQPPAYSSPYAAKPPQPTPGANTGTPSNPPGQPAPSQQALQAGPPPQIQQHGVPVAPQTAPAHPTAGAKSGPSAAPNAVPAVPAAPPKPAVDRSVVTFIKRFSTQVINQLEKRTPRAEAIAMSVVNRSIGLAQESSVPGEEALEKIIFGVFQTYKTSFPKTVAAESGGAGADPEALARAASGQFLDPRLVAVVLRFKSSMVDILKGKLGQQKSEALVLSAIDRVLGFTERSMMHTESETERKEFADAENVLMGGMRQRIDEYVLAQTASR